MTPRTLTACVMILSALALCRCAHDAPKPEAPLNITHACDVAVVACEQTGQEDICDAALACVGVARHAARMKRKLMACALHRDVDAQVCRREVFDKTQRVKVLERERWYWGGAILVELLTIILLSVLR